MPAQELNLARSATGYWLVRRGEHDLAGAPTLEGAERERAVLERLGEREGWRRSGERSSEPPGG